MNMKSWASQVSLVGSVAAVLVGLALVASCSSERKTGYKMTGSVVDAKDGDSVFLELMEGRDLRKVASAVIADGMFSMQGEIDTTSVYFISCATEGSAFSTPIFLDGAEIKVRLEDVNEHVTGTPANEAYDEVRTRVNEARRKMLALEADSTLTDEQKDEMFDPLDVEYTAAFKDGMKKNITNIVGIFLFKQRFWENSLSENLDLIARIPAHFHQDLEIQGIKGILEKQKQTDATQPYTDLELQTPEGKTVRLSDYVGKGKPVLVDFWASWCGPCRQSMPELVALYAKYKGKFEIVGISLDEDKDAWVGAMAKLGITWPQMSDLKGWKSIAAKEYGVNAIPHTVLIDKEGVIVARELEGENLEENLINLF